MQKLYIALVIATFIVGFSSKAISESATLPQEDRYAPTPLGIPETIGGYFILAVLTDDNFVCMRPGERRLIFQSPQLTAEGVLLEFSKERIKQDLQDLNLAEYAQWGWDIVGPGTTREQLVSQLEQSYRFFKAHGCPTLGPLPITTRPASPGSEIKTPPPYQAYAVIQDVDAGAYTDDNGQSVFLVAPTVGNNQQQYSAFLNNVLTDTDYFLQAGFLFIQGVGIVVWTDNSHNLIAQPFSIPYYANHVYWTTIPFTSGIWWMCALDSQNTSTYTCQGEPGATGTNLKRDANTDIFAENWNKNGDWYVGFSDGWVAFGAKIYRGGIGYDWSSQDIWTVDACIARWPPEEVIFGSLVGSGSANFKTRGIPPYCE